MLKETDLSFTQVASAVRYERRTGRLIWKARPAAHFADDRSAKSWNTQYAGKPVGYINEDGYVRFSLSFNGKSGIFAAHRVAWMLLTKTWPAGFLDHRDGCKSNNRRRNLRPATTAQNAWNCTIALRGNASETRGVSLHKRSGLWRARIYVNGRELSLGYFKTINEAATARRAAEINHTGEFAPIQKESAHV